MGTSVIEVGDGPVWVVFAGPQRSFDRAAQSVRLFGAALLCPQFRVRSFVACLVCVGGGVLGGNSQAAGDDPVPALSAEELVALWDARRSEVFTAGIECLCFNGSIPDSAITSERLAELIGAQDLAAEPESLRPFLESVLDRSLAGQEPWSRMEISISGRRHRQDDGELTFLRDGRHDFLEILANRQVTIYQPGQSGFGPYGLDDFRWTPPAPMTADRVRITDSTGESSQIEFVPQSSSSSQSTVATAVVDNTTGIVTHKVTRIADGTPLKERYQLGISRYPGDIDWPTASLEAVYANGRLNGLRVMLILSARFNETVPEERFVLDAAQGTSVIDHRGPDVAGFKLASDVADLRSVIGAVRQPGAPAAVPPADPAVRQLLLWFHAICLLAAGIWLWRRKRRRTDSST